MRSFRTFHVLLLFFLSVLLLAGCDQKELLQKFVPKEDDVLARHFIEVVRTGDYSTTEQMLVPSMRDDKAQAGMRDLNQILDHGVPVSVEVIGCQLNTNTTVQGTMRTTNLSYQIQFPDAWAVGYVIIAHQGEEKGILGAYFKPISESLEVTNRFDIAGKSVVHHLVLVICFAIPLLILFALIRCIRSRIRRKWLWILFVLMGIMQFRFNWASGQFDFQPVAFLLFGASAFQAGPYAPWVLGFAFPVGAVVFLVRRQKLLLDDVPPPPADPTPADLPE